MARDRSRGQGVAWDGRDAFYFLVSSNAPVVGGHEGLPPTLVYKHRAADGRRQWGRFAGFWGDLNGLALASDRLGNVVVTGTFGTSLDMDGDAMPDLRPRGNVDLFLASWAPDGLYRWAASAGGHRIDGAAAVAVTPTDSIYLGGLVLSSDLDANGDGVTDLSVENGSALLLRYDPLAFWTWFDFDFYCDEVFCSWFVPIELISGVAAVEFAESANLVVDGVFLRDDLKGLLTDVTGRFARESCGTKGGDCVRYVWKAKPLVRRALLRVSAKDPAQPSRFTLRGRDLQGRAYEHAPVTVSLAPPKDPGK
jgi:hypothetical protein